MDENSNYSLIVTFKPLLVNAFITISLASGESSVIPLLSNSDIYSARASLTESYKEAGVKAAMGS